MTLTPDIMGSNWIEYLKNYIFTMQLPTSVNLKEYFDQH